MTLNEFKAWFEGFTESMDSTPNPKQWERIKARVKDIDGKVVTERVYVDRYHPAPYYPYHRWAAPLNLGIYSSTNGGFSQLDLGSPPAQGFNSVEALYATGKSDYTSSVETTR